MRLDKSYIKESDAAPFELSFCSKAQTTQNYFRAYAAMAQHSEFQRVGFGFRIPMAGNFTILQNNIFCFVFNALKAGRGLV